MHVPSSNVSNGLAYSSVKAWSKGPKPLPNALRTYIAWKFDRVLPGTFRRNKAQFAHHAYPIVGPLPTRGRNTPALESSHSRGPYLYFVCDDQGLVHYVGKSQEDQVLQRWVRPGVGGPAKHYWTHSTASGGCVFNIAEGLKTGASSHYTLHYVPASEITQEMWMTLDLVAAADVGAAERAFIRLLAPDWNCSLFRLIHQRTHYEKRNFM